jgi:preprotein translocase subunit SecA
MSVFDKFLRAGEGRRYKKIAELAMRVGDFEAEIKSLSADEMRAKTGELRQRLESGEDSTRSCPRRSPASARQLSGRSGSAISTFRSSVRPFFTAAPSPR